MRDQVERGPIAHTNHQTWEEGHASPTSPVAIDQILCPSCPIHMLNPSTQYSIMVFGGGPLGGD